MVDIAGGQSPLFGDEPRRRKWRYFARRIVYAWERPSIMRKHIYTGAMGNIWASLISGLFFVYFGTAVGLTPFLWGLMGGLSSWVVVAQLLSASMTERIGRRKLVWFWFAILDRVLRLAGILLSLWMWQNGWPLTPRPPRLWAAWQGGWES